MGDDSKQKELDDREQKLKKFAELLENERDKLATWKQRLKDEEERLKSVFQVELDESKRRKLAEYESRLEVEEKRLESVFQVELDELKRIKLADYEIKISIELTQRYEENIKKLTDEYEKNLQEVLENLSKFKKENQELEIQKEQLKRDKEEFHTKIKAQEAEIIKSFTTQRNDEKTKLLAEYEAKLSNEFSKNFKDKIQEMNEKERKLLQESKNIEEQNIYITHEKDNLYKKQEEFEKKTELKYKNEIDKLKAEKEWLQENYDRLKEDYKTVLAEKENFEINVKDRNLIDERDKAKNELKLAEKKIENLEYEHVELRNKHESKLNELRKQMYSQELEIKSNGDLKNQIAKLENELECYKTRLQDDEYWEGKYNTEHQRLEEFQQIYLGKDEEKNRAKVIEQEFYKEIMLENDNKIEEKDEIKWLENIESDMKRCGIEYSQRLLFAFHTTLKSATMSPLSILSGVSGTGKSELPKLYAYFGGFNFLAEAVQPTWDSPASMMGFYNMTEGKFDSRNILKFLIQTSLSAKFKDPDCINPYGLRESMNLILLDEINLAHIELYFAEFLSKFESRRGNSNVDLNIQIGAGKYMSIKLDTNLLWVGTMNEDETTKNLSDKVLDRAYCLNFPRPTRLIDRPKVAELSELSDFKWLPRQTWQEWLRTPDDFDEEQKKKLGKFREQTDKINDALKATGRAIGHRVWQSMAFYIANHPQVIKSNDKVEAMQIAYEDQLVQKIMPKLRGIETSGEELKSLENIKEIIKDTNLLEDFELALKNPYGLFKFNSANYLEK